jgi:superfamily II DNA or RNA helicase/HKD family nuclease
MFTEGLYEQLINKLYQYKLSTLDKNKFYVKEAPLDKEEAAQYLSRYLSSVIQTALNELPKENSIEKQIELSNKVIRLLKEELDDEDFEDDLLDTNGKILSAVFSKLNTHFPDFDKHLKEITPITRFSQSELFTGSNRRLSMESELRKEILSADRIHFLVSFIKFSGIRIFEKELREFTESGKELKIITTSYMGATDVKAIEFLSSLKNTQIKISYNTQHARLHAKAYLFLRKSGFHTGYIGSSNISHAALTSGLEWNLKVTTQEISHIIKKFESTFETYWEDNEFELFDKEKDFSKLSSALKQQKSKNDLSTASFFDITPFPYQKEVLEKLEAERVLHKRFKNLVVAATGTGKTVISAFDYKTFVQRNSRARLLFIAHRKEILTQALSTFRGILRDNNFGDLWVDGMTPQNFDHVFASVQTFNSQAANLQIQSDYYDFVVIDEVHHIAAKSYRPVIQRFSPQILLGLTATPERMDGEDILSDFCNVIAAEIRLPEALNRKLLCPFQYFGITDTVDLSNLEWRNGKYVPSELTKVYTNNDNRLREIISNLKKYLNDIHDVRALGFCSSQEHASYMAEKFTLAGFKADYLVSENSDEREEKRRRLKNKEINYLFVRDIFNEGIDIPEIDTVLFLRPTESLTIFLQQLGRGLRLSDEKECLTVLDFVGNARSEYDFEGKLRTMVGKTNTSIQKEIENDFPHTPLGCSIILEKVAKEYILRNIQNATNFNRNQLLLRIKNYQHNTTQPLTLANFCNFYHLPLQQIFKRGSWKRLCAEAGVIPDFPTQNESEMVKAIKQRWLSCYSTSYFQFILKLAHNSFEVDISQLSEAEQKMLLMLYYDIWQKEKMFPSLNEAIAAIGANPTLIEEIIEVLTILDDNIDFIEKDIDLGYCQPLKIHSRYTREQIFVAFGMSTFESKSSNREGVAFIEELNTEILLITLNKSEEDYSPTTLYNDFAINECLFHWQSQNSARPEKGKGKSYIEQAKNGKKILLFVREQNDDEYGNTMAYVFLGAASFVSHEGAKPMNIKWELSEPMPPYIWKDSAKMAMG